MYIDIYNSIQMFKIYIFLLSNSKIEIFLLLAFTMFVYTTITIQTTFNYPIIFKNVSIIFWFYVILQILKSCTQNLF